MYEVFVVPARTILQELARSGRGVQKPVLASTRAVPLELDDQVSVYSLLFTAVSFLVQRHIPGGFAKTETRATPLGSDYNRITVGSLGDAPMLLWTAVWRTDMLLAWEGGQQ